MYTPWTMFNNSHIDTKLPFICKLPHEILIKFIILYLQLISATLKTAITHIFSKLNPSTLKKPKWCFCHQQELLHTASVNLCSIPWNYQNLPFRFLYRIWSSKSNLKKINWLKYLINVTRTWSYFCVILRNIFSSPSKQV